MSFDLAVAVHLGVSVDGQATAACDFVEYRDMGRPASDVVNDGQQVRFQLPWASFDGRVDANGDLAGTWVQGPRRIATVLRPTDNVVLPRRPQEPSGDLPYQQHEVAYHYDLQQGLSSLQVGATTRAGNVSIAGTLTVPVGPGPHPAIVLVSGSGPDTRDAAIMGHRLFLVLADYLTRAGYARAAL
jgi:uncharacterized protein